MVVVVSDTSPIRALAHLDRLDLLQELFGTVIIPPAVEAELRHRPVRGRAIALSGYPGIRVQAPTRRAEVNKLLQSLDAGEAEALVLAQELHAGIVLIDEAAGRAAAEQLGFIVVGTCGVLLRAKQRTLIPAVKPLLDELVDNLGFFVSRRLRAEVLRSAGENA